MGSLEYLGSVCVSYLADEAHECAASLRERLLQEGVPKVVLSEDISAARFSRDFVPALKACVVVVILGTKGYGDDVEGMPTSGAGVNEHQQYKEHTSRAEMQWIVQHKRPERILLSKMCSSFDSPETQQILDGLPWQLGFEQPIWVTDKERERMLVEMILQTLRDEAIRSSYGNFLCHIL
eukprot:m.245516 g.245516  ORF g.245516 m.245516 type:complete len:180 (+) comp37564_c0_seq1:63-602(+)